MESLVYPTHLPYPLYSHIATLSRCLLYLWAWHRTLQITEHSSCSWDQSTLVVYWRWLSVMAGTGSFMFMIRMKVCQYCHYRNNTIFIWTYRKEFQEKSFRTCLIQHLRKIPKKLNKTCSLQFIWNYYNRKNRFTHIPLLCICSLTTNWV